MYRLEELIVYQQYDIGMAAYNVKGIGPYSAYIQIRTQGRALTTPPTNVQATPINTTTILVTWSPPNPPFIHGEILGYTLLYAVANTHGAVEEVTVDSSASDGQGLYSWYLVGLMEATEYTIEVRGFTFQGDGPSSLRVSVQTPQAGKYRGEHMLRFVKLQK